MVRDLGQSLTVAVPADSSDRAGTFAVDVDFYLRLKTSGLINYSGDFLAGLVGLALVPFMLHRLGIELYGLWIAWVSVAGWLSALDLGLQFALRRDIASAHGAGDLRASARLVSAAANAYLLLGMALGAIMGAVGIGATSCLVLPPGLSSTARYVFLAGAAYVLATQLSRFGRACLEGLQRYDLASAVTISVVLVRAAGIVGLLLVHSGILAVAGFFAVCEFLNALLLFSIGRYIEPQMGFRLGRPDWPVLRRHLHFGILSQVNILLARFSDVVPALVGFLLGPAAVVPFYVAQRFPAAASGLNGSMGEVFFPAGSYAAQQSRGEARKLLRVGTRWLITLASPIFVCLMVFAPNLLQAWLGYVPATTVTILRLIATEVYLDAWGACALQMTWGRGAVRTVTAILTVTTALQLALILALAPRLGVVGAAWWMLLPLIGTNGILLWAALRFAGESVRSLLWGLRGLLLPVGVCFLVASASTYTIRPANWGGVLACMSAAALGYLLALYLGPGCEHERLMMRRLGSQATDGAMATWRATRRIFGWTGAA